MENVIIIVVLAIILGLAARYVIKARKRGQKCIGCPNAGCCGRQGDGSGCSCNGRD